MPLRAHPERGTIVICDFNQTFFPPEMVKRRPVVVVSPRFRQRDGLCTVVPLSTTRPPRIMPFHFRLTLSPCLCPKYPATEVWVKGDMIYTLSMKRLSMPFDGKDASGKRLSVVRVLPQPDMAAIDQAIKHGMGLK